MLSDLVEMLFPFKVASSGAIIFIGVDYVEANSATTTVVAGHATFDVSFGRGGGGIH